MTNKTFNLDAVKSTYGLNQKSLSELLGVSHALISRYESNTNLMPIQYVIELSERLNFKIDDFIKDSFKLNDNLKPFVYSKNWWLQVNNIKQKYLSVFNELEANLSKSNIDQKTHDFVQEKMINLSQGLLHEIFHKPTIAVAGEYASGKTSLIELLTGKKSELKNFSLTTFYVKAKTGENYIKYYNIADNLRIPNIRLLDSDNYLSEINKMECKKESANIAIVYMDSAILDVCNLLEVHISNMDDFDFYNIKSIRKQVLSSSDAIILFYTGTISRNIVNEVLDNLKYPNADDFFLDNLFLITNRIQEKNKDISFVAELFQQKTASVKYPWCSYSENIEDIKKRSFLIDYVNSKNDAFFSNINTFLKRYYNDLFENYSELLKSIEIVTIKNFPSNMGTVDLAKTYTLIWEFSKECEKEFDSIYAKTKKIIKQEFKIYIDKDNIRKCAEMLAEEEDFNIHLTTFSELKKLVLQVSFDFIEKYNSLMRDLSKEFREKCSNLIEKFKGKDKYVDTILSFFYKANSLSLENIEEYQKSSDEEQEEYVWSLQFFDQIKYITGFSLQDYLYNLLQYMMDLLLNFGDNFNSFRKGTSEAKLQRLSEKFNEVDFSLIEKRQDEFFDFLKEILIPNLKNSNLEIFETDTSFINSISAEIQTKFEQIKDSLKSE